ncbi:regulatory protein ToxS [Vibrio sp. SS-MA-C1-2]|uniref:regulatory protein ToxS n=1 Tax=Vibrio sp. SS-MA-C1-2 TaxID=2908646 RepID=UPI001F285341|nr:regulatory protein ToxS [Vibrio sp. SS-MA-C1-2]UJF18773.1 regulatory protein ToxS [Vibrio sp. SS-MA-C1-2]
MSINKNLTPQLKKSWHIILLLISIVGSFTIYHADDQRIENLLLNHGWSLKSKLILPPNDVKKLPHIDSMSANTSYLFLNNHLYSKLTILYLTDNNGQQIRINISENGRWRVNDGFLVFTDTKESHITSGNEDILSEDQINFVLTVIKTVTQQAKKVDIVDDQAILLTNLTFGSQILYIN